MGGHDEKVKPRVQVKHVAVGVFAFLTVAALVTRERHYRQRLEHDHQVQQGVCEAQARGPPPGRPTRQRPRCVATCYAPAVHPPANDRRLAAATPP